MPTKSKKHPAKHPARHPGVKAKKPYRRPGVKNATPPSVPSAPPSPGAIEAVAAGAGTALAPASVPEVFKQGLVMLSGILSRDLKPPELADVYIHIKDWEDNLVDLAKNARQRLIALATELGEQVTEAGTRRLVADGWQLEIRPQRTGLNASKVEGLLRARDLDPALGMDPVVSYELNENKLALLVTSGTLTQMELDACKYELSYNLQRPKPV